jgi:hypothetical protein
VDRLERFIAAAGSRPWAWGERDCCLTLADWVIAAGHPDPAPHLRGAYRDEAECRALVAAGGGLVAVVDGICAAAGLERVERPARGVIGVIGAAQISARQWGAIFDGRRWLMARADGFQAVTARPLAMWSVSNAASRRYRGHCLAGDHGRDNGAADRLDAAAEDSTAARA